MVGVEAVVGKKKFVVKFEDMLKKEISTPSLSYVCKTEEIYKDVDETISEL